MCDYITLLYTELSESHDKLKRINNIRWKESPNYQNKKLIFASFECYYCMLVIALFWGRELFIKVNEINTYCFTTLVLVSKNLVKQPLKHWSSVEETKPLSTLTTHLLKHMSLNLWIDIWNLDFEFSDSNHCINSCLEALSKLAKLACIESDISIIVF